MNIGERLQQIRKTLELVKAEGPENWNRLLGCWQALEQLEREVRENESAGTAVQQRNTEAAAAGV